MENNPQQQKISRDKVFTISLSCLSLVVSIIALIHTYSNQEYKKARNQTFDTPTLIDNSDSISIKFKLNKKDSYLQEFSIILPDEISKSKRIANTQPLEIPSEDLETLVKNKVSSYIERNDSSIHVGIFDLPVVAEYNVIVGGLAFDRKEFRLLRFIIKEEDDNFSVKYNTSILISDPDKENEYNLEEMEDIKRFLSKEYIKSLTPIYQATKID